MHVVSDNGGNIANAFPNQEDLMDAYASKLKVQKTCTAATAVW